MSYFTYPPINAAPMTILLGTQDLSIRTPLVEPEVIPTHLPKIYLYAQKGPTGPQLVVGNGRQQMYGDDTFDLRKEYANHQTVLSNLVNAQGNAQMIERMMPADAGPKANFLLSIDILSTDITVYERDQDGNYILDGAGLPTPVTPAATVPGYRIKWVLSHVTTKQPGDVDSDLFGDAAQSVGDQMDGATQSVRYPILQFWAHSEGKTFNNSGLRIWAPTDNSSGGVNTKIMETRKVYPFRMAAIRRSSETATARIVDTQDGSANWDFTFKRGVINPFTDAQFSFENQYVNKYSDTKDPRFQPVYADLQNVAIYQSNIETVLGMLYAAEKPEADVGTDFDTTDDDDNQKWLFNFFTAVSSSGAPYYAVEVDTASANAVRMSESTNLWARGGSDGTMNDALFAGLVGDAVAEYANPNSPLMDTATQVESIIYDTGFPLATKYELCKFISERKDTAVVLATYDVNGQPNISAAEDNSLAIALRTRLQMYPESDYFGTPTMRGVIIGRHGVLRNSQYTKRLPLTLELAIKAARMMGAGNGIWKPEFLFDRAPLNAIDNFTDVNIQFTPAKQRVRDWDVGLNYPIAYSRRALFFPAIKTVYDNDTSVLNSFFTMMCCVELQKVGERVWREFTGTVALTDAQLIDRVNKSVERRTVGRFAEMFKIVPDAKITEADAQRGFSWTLPIKLYANNMRTVQNLYIQAYRMSDYVDPNA